MADETERSGPPVSTLVEWQAPALTPDAARDIAERTIALIGHFPGFVEGRFFGDFVSGRHFYLLTWRDQAALDDYAKSEQMLGVREIAGAYNEGRPTRLILSDYSVRDAETTG
jgi:hypothetical protein